MFEDSLMESAGRIKTRSKWTAIGSLLLQSLLLIAVILLPEIYPEALPKQALSRLLVAPPPPSSTPPRSAPHAPAASRLRTISLLDALTAPSHIPKHPALGVRDSGPGPLNSTTSIGELGNGLPPGLNDLVGRPEGTPVVPAALPKRVRVSSGVAAGLLIQPIRPVYPAIAKQARVQGTVVVQATISRDGTVENVRATSGPALLQGAAVAAVRVARYKPFLLNDQPVDIEATINVVFSLGN